MSKYEVIKDRILGVDVGGFIELDDETAKAYGKEYVIPFVAKKEKKEVKEEEEEEEEAKTKGIAQAKNTAVSNSKTK